MCLPLLESGDRRLAGTPYLRILCANSLRSRRVGFDCPIPLGILPTTNKPTANDWCYALTSDPIFSPLTTFRMFPRSLRLKTMMGRLLSLHSEMAVKSITRSPSFSTSM